MRSSTPELDCVKYPRALRGTGRYEKPYDCDPFKSSVSARAYRAHPGGSARFFGIGTGEQYPTIRSMKGRIKRKLLQEQAWQAGAPETTIAPICPLCARPIPPSQRDAHHLVPKSRGGRETAWLHRICHRQLHALISEGELASRYNHVEALLAHPEVARFVQWVKTKPDDFFEKTRKSREKGRRIVG